MDLSPLSDDSGPISMVDNRLSPFTKIFNKKCHHRLIIEPPPSKLNQPNRTIKDRTIKYKRKCNHRHHQRHLSTLYRSYVNFHYSTTLMHSIFVLLLVLYQQCCSIYLSSYHNRSPSSSLSSSSSSSLSIFPVVISLEIDANFQSSIPRFHPRYRRFVHNNNNNNNHHFRPLVGANSVVSLSTSDDSAATIGPFSTGSASNNCPSVCVCIWKSGKQTATCDHRSLISVPTGLVATTQVIDLSGNLLGRLGSGVFQERGLVNLQRIFLVNCRLAEISPETFQKLSNLIELDLANNSLSTIPSKSLVECVALRRLSLAGNQLVAVKSGAFLSLARLQVLDLSANQISHLDTDAFRGLRSLQTLKLDQNQLQTLPAAESFVQFLPAKLASLELHDNRWQCDCHLRPIREWIVLNNIPLPIKPNCYNPPRLQGQSWDSISAAEFSCPPQIHSTNGNFYKHIGNNVTISCPVTGYPPPQIYWLFENMILPDGGIDSISDQNRSMESLNRRISSNSPTATSTSTKLLQSKSEMDSDLLLELNSELDENGAGEQFHSRTGNFYPPLHLANDSFGYTADHVLPNLRYQISQERENHLITSTLTVSALQPYDSQRIVCVARNLGGIVWKNFSLIVSTQEPFSSSRSMDFIVTEMFVIFVSIAILLVSVLIFVSVFIAKFKKQRRSTSSVYDCQATMTIDSTGNGYGVGGGGGGTGGPGNGGVAIGGYLADIQQDGTTTIIGQTNGATPNYTTNHANLMLMNGTGQLFNANHLVATFGTTPGSDTGDPEKCIMDGTESNQFHPHSQYSLYQHSQKQPPQQPSQPGPVSTPPPPLYNQLHSNRFLSAVPNSNGAVLMVNTIDVNQFINQNQSGPQLHNPHPSSLCSTGSSDPNSLQTDLSSQSTNATTQSLGPGHNTSSCLKAMPNSNNVSPNNSTDSSGTYFGGYNSSSTTATTTTSGSQLPPTSYPVHHQLGPSNELAVLQPHSNQSAHLSYPAYATLQRPGRGHKPDLISSTNSDYYHQDLLGSQRVNICDYQHQQQQQSQHSQNRTNVSDAYPLLNSAELIYGTRIAPTRLNSQSTYLTTLSSSMSCHGNLGHYQSQPQSNSNLESQQQQQSNKSNKLVKFADQLCDQTKTCNSQIPNSYATLRLHNTNKSQQQQQKSIQNGCVSNWNGSSNVPNNNGTLDSHSESPIQSMMMTTLESSVDSGEQILTNQDQPGLGQATNKKNPVEPLDETEEDDYYRNLNGQ